MPMMLTVCSPIKINPGKLTWKINLILIGQSHTQYWHRKKDPRCGFFCPKRMFCMG